MVARRYFISGDVQGVGFRYFVLRQAQRLPGVKGFVRNLRDGRVEAYAEGQEEQIKELESSLRKGPRGSTVDRVETHEETPGGQYQDFKITF